MRSVVCIALLALVALASASRIAVVKTPSLKLEAAPARAAEKAVGDAGCSICVFLATAVEGYINANPNATLAEVEAEVDNICAFLGPYASTCVALANAELPAILQWLENLPPAQVCQQIGACTSDKVAAKEAPVAAPADLPCEICTMIVTYAEYYVQANPNATEAEIEAVLDGVCAYLPGYEAMCQAFVAAEVPQILAYLETMTPAQVCALIGTCSTATKAVKLVEAPARLSPLVKLEKAAATKVGDSSLSCQACTLVVTYAQTYIKSNPNMTEANIEAKLDTLCGTLGATSAECVLFVAATFPTLYTFLTTSSAAQVCQTVKLCTTTEAAVVKTALVATVPAARAEAAPLVSRQATVPCEVCTMAFTLLDQFLQANPNATTAEIEAFLDLVCDLTGSFEAQCDSFVAQYVPLVISYIGSMTANQICALIGVCPSTLAARLSFVDLAAKSVALAPASHRVGDLDQCTLCQTLISFLQNYMVSHASTTEKQLEATANRFCSLFPSSVATTCSQMAAQYIPKVYNKLATEDELQICEDISLCGTMRAAAATMAKSIKFTHATVQRVA